jgi:hypothetical protein
MDIERADISKFMSPEIITWCRYVTKKFQQQAERRWTMEDVEGHHQGEIDEFWEEINAENKEKIVLEFWDTIFSMLTMLAVDDLKHITDEEWYEGYRKTVEKINRRVITEHYKKERNEYG